jgi:hypothetical protein
MPTNVINPICYGFHHKFRCLHETVYSRTNCNDERKCRILGLRGPGPILVVAATLTGALGVWVGMNGMWKGWGLKLEMKC